MLAVVIPTATAGSNTTQIANTAFVTAAMSAAYPIGSIYINAGVRFNSFKINKMMVDVYME